MGLFIASFVFIVLSFVGMIFLGKINYLQEEKMKYSFLSMFPYELSSKSRGKFYIFYRICLYLYVAFSFTPILFLFLKYQHYQSLTSFIIFLSVLFVIQAVIFLSLNIIEAKYIKTHALIATLYFAFSLLTSGGGAIFLINMFIKSPDGYLKELILGILLAIVALALLVIMLNPRLKKWPELEQVINEDGSQELKRPKLFILAFSEWLVVFLNFIAQIIILLAYL